MKARARLFLALLTLCVLSILPALGEPSTEEFTAGSFRYRIPSSWNTVSESGASFHYAGEAGQPDDGLAYALSQTVEEKSPESEEEARRMLTSMVHAMMDTDKYKSELLNQFDIELCGRYSSLFRLKSKVFGQIHETNCLLVLNGQEFLMVVYLDRVNTPDEQLKIFSDIVNSISVQD